jgi:cell filamentation protein
MIPGDKTVNPATGVFWNKAGISDEKDLRKYEYHRSSLRELELREKPIVGNYDIAHLQAIHKHLFQDVYPWAGEFREVDFSKYNAEMGAYGRFARRDEFAEVANRLEQQIIQHKRLEGLKKAEFVNAISDVYQTLNELHPFREGNGRATKLMLQQLAAERGYIIDYTKVDKTEWNKAAAASVMLMGRDGQLVSPGEKMPLREMFSRIVEPTTAHVFRVYDQAEAIKLKPELKQSYERLDAVRAAAQALYGPDAAQVLVAEERKRIQATLDTGTRIELAIHVSKERERVGYEQAIEPMNRPIAAAFKHLPREQAESLFPELKGAFRSIDAAEKHAKLVMPAQERGRFVADAKRMIYTHLLRYGEVPAAAQKIADPGKDKAKPTPVRAVKTPERDGPTR